MSRFTPRFHVHLAQQRTTVSLDTTLVTLLALKLNHTPGSSEAHQAIRHWLQQRLDDLSDPGLYQVSQWLQSQVVLALMDNKLSKRYDAWLRDDSSNG